MIQPSLAFLILSSFLTAAPGRTFTPPEKASCPAMPATLSGYRLTETRPFEDTTQGIAYRFAGPTDERVTVFVYPIAAELRTGDDVQAWVTAEGQKFEKTFDVGVQRGWFQEYRFAFAHPEPITVDGANVPGFIAAASTKSRGRISVELQYLYAVCDRFLKVRATLDARTWTESDVPTFAKDLATYLASH